MFIGFKRIKIQPFDTAGEPEGAAIVIEGAKNGGASQEATISGISSEPVKVWGSDGPYYIAQKGTGDISVALTVIDIPIEEEARILGYKKDTQTGAMLIGEGTEPPYCGLILESSDAQGNAAMIGFFKGKFRKGDLALKTKDGPNYTPAGDSYTFSASTSDRDDNTKGNAMAMFYGTEEKKAAVEELVFGTGAGV